MGMSSESAAKVAKFSSLATGLGTRAAESYIQRVSWTITVIVLFLVLAGMGVFYELASHFAPNLVALCAREIFAAPLCP